MVFPVVKDWGSPSVHALSPHPPGLGRGPPETLPLNFLNTKKLKYFNILVFFFFFLVPEFIPWVLGSHCVLYIYIYIYIMCIYIYIIFFWLGLFLIQSYKVAVSPGLTGLSCGAGG